MALWETLIELRDFLAEKSRKQTVFFILARCKISKIRSQANQYDSLDALIKSDRCDTSAENLIDGLQHQQSERWADWVTQINMRIDSERIMAKLADKYMPSLKHVIALYYLTTQVGKEDAAHIVTTDVWRCFQWYGIPVQNDVQYEFAEVFLEQHSYEPAGELVLVKAHPNHGRFTSIGNGGKHIGRVILFPLRRCWRSPRTRHASSKHCKHRLMEKRISRQQNTTDAITTASSDT